jgi:hypothetical protein
MRGALRVAAGFGAIGLVACTSILGDFTAGKAGGGSEPDATVPTPAPDAGETAPDAGVPDAGDASSDAEAGAGTGQLSCSNWLWNTPVVVEDLSNAPSHTYLDRFAVFLGNANEVRILAGKSETPAFSLYTVNKATMAVTQVDSPPADGGGQPFVSVIRHVSAAQGGTSAVVVGQRTAAITSYTVTAMSDLMPAAGPLPAPFPLLSDVLSTQVIDDLAVLPFSPTDIFEAVSIGTGNPSNYTLGVTRVSPTSTPVVPSTLATIATSPNEADFGAIRLLHTNSSVYIYDLNDISTPGTSGWTVPDTAVVTSPPTKQIIASGESVGVIGLGPSTSAPAADVFMLEQDFSAQFTSGFKYYVGTVPFTALSSWTQASLTKLSRGTSPFAAPVFNSSPAQNAAIWFDDNAMLLGPGLRNGVTDAGPGPGLNLLWVTAAGAIRADQIGMSEILNDRANFFWAGAVPSRISATSAAWDVVWVEAISNNAGAVHHVMRMNELQCQ